MDRWILFCSIFFSVLKSGEFYWCRPLERADVVFIVEDSYSTGYRDNSFSYQQQFISKIVGQLYIDQNNGIRVGLVKYNELAYKIFDLDDYTTQSSIQNAITALSATRRQWIYENDTDYIAYGIDKARDNVFQSAYGDRADAPNYYIFTTDGIFGADYAKERSDQVRSLSSENYVWAIGVYQAQSQSELSTSAGSTGRYYTGSSWSSINTDANAISFYEMMSGCLRSDPSIGKYYCFYPSFLFYEEPASAVTATEVCENDQVYILTCEVKISSTLSEKKGAMFFLADDIFDISCCGIISAWEFYPCTTGIIEFMVWSLKSGNTYELKGINYVEVIPSDLNGTTITAINYTVPEAERISIVENDKIGWRVSTTNVISYKPCDILTDRYCPQNTYRTIHTGSVYEYMQFEWVASSGNTSTVTALANRGYTVKAYANNNTAVGFVESLYLTSAADHWPVGTSFSSYELVGVDYKENATLTWQLANSYIALNESFSFTQVARQLEPSESAIGLAGYRAILRAVDTCRWTASTTFTVETFNGPPIITNFPKEMSLLETTGADLFVYKIAVYDPTVPPDPVCCTLESVRPQTQNFKVELVNGTDFLLYTTEKPIFAYADVNSYMLTACCEDGLGTVKGILKIDIEQVKEKEVYIPPSWFYTSVIAGLIPIALMFMMSCFLLFYTMFFASHA